MTIEIKARDRNGAEHSLQAAAGKTVMETLRDAGLPVEAICGGCCSCATCHVYVDSEWLTVTGPRGDAEDELLRLSDYLDVDRSRLGCQIRLSGQHNGLSVTLAPEE
jgi:2Fe-2S ferredoxin